jgi:hypothetical protein
MSALGAAYLAGGGRSWKLKTRLPVSKADDLSNHACLEIDQRAMLAGSALSRKPYFVADAGENEAWHSSMNCDS